MANKINQKVLNNSFNKNTQNSQHIKYINFTYIGTTNHKITKLFKNQNTKITYCSNKTDFDRIEPKQIT